MDTAFDQDFREDRAKDQAAMVAEAAAMAAAMAAAVARVAQVVTPPGAAPAGEAEDLLPVQGGMQKPPPDSPTYSPLRPGQGPPVAKEPRYEEEDE